MKIKSVELKNFKFHHKLTIDFIKDDPDVYNSLIYGENGTGKSSIFEALYSNFYEYRRVKTVNVHETFKNRNNLGEDLEVNVLFTENLPLKRTNNNLTNLPEFLSVFCVNERILTRITKENFYRTIKDTLQEHFITLKSLHIFSDFQRKLQHTTQLTEDIRRERDALDEEFNRIFEKVIPKQSINKVLEKLEAGFTIDFDIQHSENTDKFKEPNIEIKINEVETNGKLYNHFNEAKLKLISIAIYFALVRKNQEHDIKILVLDDFLTSLDMVNRKLIVQYILDEFEDYQKIILTHNLQFYNLITKLLGSINNHSWNINTLYLSNNNTESIMSSKKQDYLQLATQELNIYNLESSGNYLRKEFERINTEFEQLLTIGRVEDLNVIIENIKSNDLLLPNPNKIINDFYILFNNIENNRDQSKESKYNQLASIINNNIKELKFKAIKSNRLKDIIRQSEFYKGTLMNYASHDDTSKELYTREFKYTIKLLNQLNKILNELN